MSSTNSKALKPFTFIKAACTGHIGYVHFLIKTHGVPALLAPDQVCDGDGLTMLHMACMHDFVPLVAYLRRAVPVLMTMRDHGGITPLEVCVALGHHECAAVLSRRSNSRSSAKSAAASSSSESESVMCTLLARRQEHAHGCLQCPHLADASA